MARQATLRGFVFAFLAWALLLSFCVGSFNVQMVVAQTVASDFYSSMSPGPRGWGWLSPFRFQQEEEVRSPGMPTGKLVRASVTDMPQQPSRVRPAVAESLTSDYGNSIEWPAQQANVPPELNRRSSRRNRPGWMNWSQASVQTNETDSGQKKSARQKSNALNPFSWANYSEAQGQDSHVTKTAAESNSGDAEVVRQGSSPFSWTNAVAPPQEASAGGQVVQGASKLEAAASVLPTRQELTSPITWSNDLNNEKPPRPLEPPVQTSFSESVQQALKWEDYTDESEKKMLEASRPPKNATVEQQIEWEKQKYPWIRPFYWSEDLDAPSSAYEEFRESTQTSPGRSRATAIIKPFLWTNEEPAMVSKPRKVGDSRTVAFLQGEEEIPLPPKQPLLPGQEELPRSQADSDIDLFESKKERQEREASEPEEGLLGEAGEEGKGAIGEAETLGREPVDNSLQFLRADTVLLDPGEAQYDYGMTYSLFDQRIPVILTSTSGTSVVLARFRRREMLAPLEVRFGLTRRIQLFLNAPFGWSNAEFAVGPIEDFENDGGLGDIVAGGTFLMRQGNHEKSDAILTLAATAPTGQDPFGLVTGLAPGGAALGGGTWSLASSMLFVRNYDPVVVFYGFGTRQHFLRKVQGVSFRAGGEYNYQMGVGFAVNERVTFSTRFNGAYVTETRLGGQRIRGTIQEPMAIGLAMTIAKEKKLIEPFVNFGLTDDTNSVRFGITWTR